MIASGVLEAPGRWRVIGLVLGLALAVLPVLPILRLLAAGSVAGLGPVFWTAAGRSLLVAGAASLVSILVGLPAGLVTALYEFSLRRFLLAALALPLVVPSFLWAIGLSMFRIQLGLARNSLLSGAPGVVLAFAALGIPLVFYTTYAATRSITGSQADAVRLAAGEASLLRYAARGVFPAAVLAALLAGVLTLSDPGPGQILGFSGIATQILTSFSALYDFEAAATQCAVLAGLVLAVALPVAWLAAPRVSSQLLATDTEPVRPIRYRPVSILAPVLLGTLVVVIAVVPLAGLVLPTTRAFPFLRAMREVLRTAGNTILYATAAGSLAAVAGAFLAVCAGRQRRLRRLLLTGLLVLLSLPPSLAALGMIQTAGQAPAALDIVFRSRFTVGALLALRFLPVATILAMRSLGTFSPSWVWAATAHGVGLGSYLRRILVPLLAPASLLAALLVGLLATAEVTTALLVQPPGEASLPVTIFTVMANAPESLVATLCLLYVAGTGLLLAAGWNLRLLLRRPSASRIPEISQ